MKTMTSAAANKWIKSLEDEKRFYLTLEENSSVYTLGEGEQEEKPEYDYDTVSHQIAELDQKIRKIRHAVNVFNTTTVLPELNLTVDEALVKMAQLNSRKSQLDVMRKRLPKSRVNSFLNRTKSVVEYEYTNYDIEKAKRDYRQLSEEIVQIQLSLDVCNQTKVFCIDED